MLERPTVTGPTPDLTAAQLAAVAGWIVAQAVAFGWIEQTDAQLAVSVGSTVLAAVLKLADAYLRGERARAQAIATVADAASVKRLVSQ